jgi:hypothetical protein
VGLRPTEEIHDKVVDLWIRTLLFPLAYILTGISHTVFGIDKEEL